MVKTKDGRELLDIIEEGIAILERKICIKWPTNYNSKITKDKLINAIHDTYVKDIQLYEALNYAYSSGCNNSLRNIFNRVDNRASGLKWTTFFIGIIGHKQCSECKEVYRYTDFSKDSSSSDGFRSNCKFCQLKYRVDNADEISEKAHKKRRKTVLHIIDVMIREGKLPECSICGYKENWAALEFHHINPDLKRPDWAYTKSGNKSSPANYILGVSKKLAEKRYLYEINNLGLLCANCHKKEHNSVKGNKQKGIKEALPILGFVYICEEKDCDEDINLHLHHNNPNEKKYSFGHFGQVSKDRILKDEYLEKEMTKDVSILCGNHHRSIHNPKWDLANLGEAI